MYKNVMSLTASFLPVSLRPLY